VLIFVSLLPSCRDWDRFDPRLGGGAPASASSGVGGAGTGGGGPGSGGAGGAGGGGAQGPCGTIGMLSDDFEDGLGSDYFDAVASPGASVVEQGGELVFSHRGDDFEDVSYATPTAYDASDSPLTIELPTVSLATDVSFYFVISRHESPYVEFQITADDLAVNTEEDNLTSLPYDARDHRFLRFQPSASDLSFETSPDGSTWTAQTSAPLGTLGFDLGYVNAGFYMSGVAAGQTSEARVAAIDGGASSGYCPIARLADDFEGGTLDAKWLPDIGGGCGTTQAGGNLLLYVDQGVASWCEISAASLYDMTRGAFSFEVVTFPEATSQSAVTVYLGPDAEDFASFTIDNGELRIERTDEGLYSDLVATSFDPVDHRFLRMSIDGDYAVFEASSDGSAWNELSRVVSFFDPEKVVVAMEVRSDAGPPDLLEVRLDNVNILP
jgi:hypothetical protein